MHHPHALSSFVRKEEFSQNPGSITKDRLGYTGMTQNMDMTAMAKIFISNSIINFKKWY